MKILIIMDPGILVPPVGYGGHERLVAMFAEEYKRLGHEVHLLVTEGSYIQGCIVHPFGKEGFPPKKSDALKAIPKAWHFIWKHRKDYHLVHNFGRLAYLLPILNRPVNKIMTYGREITSRNIRYFNRIGQRNILFTGCSRNLLLRVDSTGDWEVVYNAIRFNKYTLQTTIAADAPLIFLGRIERIKGCHTAVAVARQTGKRLIIAGNISPLPEEQEYFKKMIEPFIDGKQVKYIGAVNDAQKNEWLGKASALLFPIEWSEPFGIVMIEAMACGTPVIAFNHGSVEEVVEEGVTGFKVNTLDEMVAAVKMIGSVNRTVCREQAAARFDVSVIAGEYLSKVKSLQKKIVIVTTGQPAANPRVLKEYLALKEKGHRVKVLYTYSAEWSFKIDEEKFRSGALDRRDFHLIGGEPNNAKLPYFFSRFIFRVMSALVRMIPTKLFKEITIVRASFYLWWHTKKYPAAIYIAHYLGALPAALRAAARFQSAVIFDAEDFHRGEEPYYPGQIKDVIQMEDLLLPQTDLITTSSPLISKAYKNLYPSRTVITLKNVFSRQLLQKKDQSESEALKLFWFSQNIGPNRGLEVIIDALNLIDEPISLTLLGNIRNQFYFDQLISRSNRPACIHTRQPVKPEEIFGIAHSFDIGLAADIPYCENRDICLTNKIFTYLQAGNCILASDTAAQKDFMMANQAIGFLYKYDDYHQLAALIRQLFYDRTLLSDCKRNALALAASEFNWEMESEKLIGEVNALVDNG